MKKEQEIYKLRIYNNPEVNFLDVINAFKTIGFTTLQAEQCATIIHTKGKYDIIEGNIYELDAIRVDLQNMFGIISEVFPTEKTIKHPINNVMEEKTSQPIFELMQSNWQEFETSHLDFKQNGTKKSAARARKAIQALKTMITDYKKASVEDCKAI